MNKSPQYYFGSFLHLWSLESQPWPCSWVTNFGKPLNNERAGQTTLKSRVSDNTPILISGKEISNPHPYQFHISPSLPPSRSSRSLAIGHCLSFDLCFASSICQSSLHWTWPSGRCALSITVIIGWCSSFMFIFLFKVIIITARFFWRVLRLVVWFRKD